MSLPNPALQRSSSLAKIRDPDQEWDLLVIGGGATGAGIALDAASRGLRCALVERFDFGKGTSSRSTKLVHGGVRYLRQGNLTLVRDALQERSLLLKNASHLVYDLPFVIPCANLWQRIFYGIGLKLYDLLASRDAFGRSRTLGSKQARNLLPVVRADQLNAAVVYHDGQFDDSRLLINMLRTAEDLGACVVNYVGMQDLLKDAQGRVIGATLIDHETQSSLPIKARCVVNATGPFCDSVRRIDDPNSTSMVAASQGVHIVLPHRFFASQAALMVPKTSDGRVLFAIPWHGHVVVGTTDTPIPEAIMEPTAQASEIQFLLDTLADYLTQPPRLDDITSVFTGVRPLVRGDKSARTASLARDHVIQQSASGLITITGGKWTTVRKMSEDCVNRVEQVLRRTPVPCSTASILIHGAIPQRSQAGATNPEFSEPDAARRHYGTDLALIRSMETREPELASLFHDQLPIRRSDVVWAVHMEMARTVEDVLARRTRCLFLNSHASLHIARRVAEQMHELLQPEGGARNPDWIEQQVAEFAAIARHYSPAASMSHGE